MQALCRRDSEVVVLKKNAAAGKPAAAIIYGVIALTIPQLSLTSLSFRILS